MSLSSFVFLLAFLPLLLAVYYLVPRKARNAVLCLFGVAFCALGGLRALLPLTFATLAAFAAAYGYERSGRDAWIVCGTIAVIAPLLCCKCVPALRNDGLPQGISFYTFSLVSYLADLRRGQVERERHLCRLAGFSALLPLLGAGPILRYGETAAQLRDRRETFAAFGAGVGRFFCGLGKKLIFGDAFAQAHRFLQDLSGAEPTTLGAYLSATSYLLYLYYDFSGYTDMILGVGQLFGFRFPENFDYPFTARGIGEFWRRWHMSLSGWFRDYVYIPLGGNRCGKLRLFCNLMAVWLLTGLWHGIGWNYMLWGCCFGALLFCEKVFLRRLLNHLPSLLVHLYTLLAVLIGFSFFSCSDAAVLRRSLLAMVGIGTVGLTSPVVTWQALRLLPLLLLAALGTTALPRKVWGRVGFRLPFLQPLGVVALATLCLAYLADSSFLPFAYLNF